MYFKYLLVYPYNDKYILNTLTVKKKMNASKKRGIIWWGTAGCGSRSFQGFLVGSGIDDLINVPETCVVGSECSHTHAQGIPKGYENCKIICNTRNPYSRAVSSYLDEYVDLTRSWGGKPFKTWLKEDYFNEERSQNVDHFYMLEWPEIGREPDYMIRMEHMEEDVRNCPPLMNGDTERIEDAIESSLRRNNNKNENPHDEYIGNFQHFQKYYDQESADLVYTKLEEYFTKFGYERDSWLK